MCQVKIGHCNFNSVGLAQFENQRAVINCNFHAEDRAVELKTGGRQNSTLLQVLVVQNYAE